MNVLRNKKALDSKSRLTMRLAGKKRKLDSQEVSYAYSRHLIDVMVINFLIKVSLVRKLSMFNSEPPGSSALFIQHEAKQVTELNADITR